MASHEPGADREIPLFPLGEPLYPGIPLRLRIFEQRYLRLVGDCAREGRPFGIVAILRGAEVGAPPEIYPWGTLVHLRDWEQQEDGLLGIRVQGEQRFRVLHHRVGPLGLLLGQVQLVEESPGQRLGRGSHTDLSHLLAELETRLGPDQPREGAPVTEAELAWRLATLLPLERGTRLEILAEPDPGRRLELVRAGLEPLMAGRRRQ